MKTYNILIKWVLVFVLNLVIVSCKEDCSEDGPFLPPSYLTIYDGKLFPGYDLDGNTSEGRTDWFKQEDGYFRMAYPDSQSWGAVFIIVGEATDFPRESKDLSEYKELTIELRGESGDEFVFIGLKDNTDPDDGSETKIHVNLTRDWNTYTFPLSDFKTADLTRLYVLTEFVFDEIPQTVYFREIKYWL